eukprot:jgi/Botrbrau1/6464/Bobra.0034s0039.1
MTSRLCSTANVLLMCLAVFIHSPIQAENALQWSPELSAQALPVTSGIPIQISGPISGNLQGEAQSESLVPNQAAGIFGSHAAVSMPLITQLPVSTVPVEPVPGAKTVYPRSFFSEDGTRILEDLQQSPLRPQDLYSTSGAKPLYCVNNPIATFYPPGTVASSICRSFLYLKSDRSKISACTAFFVSSTHVALAGHCVAAGGSKTYLPVLVNGKYGTVCCRAGPSIGVDNCPAGYGFDVLQVTTTSGWFNNGSASNDGALLKVRRPTVATNVGVPLAYGQADQTCPNNTLTYAGYPADNGWLINFLSGCSVEAAERLAFSNTGVRVGCFTPDVTLPAFSFVGSTCGGVSGAPLWNPPTNTVWGIHTQGSPICINSTSNVGFSAITNGNTQWGVSIAALMKAIP